MTSLFSHANGCEKYHREEREKQQCSGNCDQGRECDCKPMHAAHQITDLQNKVVRLTAERDKAKESAEMWHDMYKSAVLLSKDRLANKGTEIQALEAERDELVNKVKDFLFDWDTTGSSGAWPVRTIQELRAALSKIKGE
jgi:uncharacterized coiled-coil DUF342 family protein